MKQQIGRLLWIVGLGYVCTSCAYLAVGGSLELCAHWITQTFFHGHVSSASATTNEARFFASLLWFAAYAGLCEWLLRARPYWVIQQRWLSMMCMTLTGRMLLQCLMFAPALHPNELAIVCYVAVSHIICFSFIFRFQKRFQLERSGFDLHLGLTAIWPVMVFYAQFPYMKFLFLKSIVYYLALFVTPVFLMSPLFFPRDQIKRIVWVSITGVALSFLLLSDFHLMRGLIEWEWNGAPFRWLVQPYAWVVVLFACIPVSLNRLIAKTLKWQRDAMKRRLK